MSEEAVRTDCAWFSPAFLYSREQASCPTDHRQLLEPSGSRDSPLVLEDAGLDWRHPGDADTVGGEMFQAPRVSQSGSFHCRNQFGLLKAAGELGSTWQELAAWLSPHSFALSSFISTHCALQVFRSNHGKQPPRGKACNTSKSHLKKDSNHRA